MLYPCFILFLGIGARTCVLSKLSGSIPFQLESSGGEFGEESTQAPSVLMFQICLPAMSLEKAIREKVKLALPVFMAPPQIRPSTHPGLLGLPSH